MESASTHGWNLTKIPSCHFHRTMGQPEREGVINLLCIDGLSNVMTSILSGTQQLSADNVRSNLLFIPPLRIAQIRYLQAHIWLKNYLPNIGNALKLKEEPPASKMNGEIQWIREVNAVLFIHEKIKALQRRGNSLTPTLSV